MSGGATTTDVLVLGSGLAGSIAALCLCRSGLRVVLLDQGTHPRFALGESTTTPATLWLRVLAARFHAPELLEIASAEGLVRSVAATSGVKNNFGFVYHREGAERPERAWQAIIPQAFLAESEHGRQGSFHEMHYFRQDVDAWLWTTALAAGAIGRPATAVRELTFDDGGAVAVTAAGETLRARFVVDASGYRSPVAQRLGLRDEPPRLRTHSRSLFTHMAGVVPFEQTGAVPPSMARFSQGTLHHWFDGGWLWVIPFDNHRASTNRLCSVGLNLDSRRFPKPPGTSAEHEWRALLERFPAIRAQFRDAVAVRPWVDTGRVQYSSRACIGDRFWLTSHAAGTVDALYSMGNINTFHTLAVGLSAIVRAFAQDRFAVADFAPLQRLSDELLRFQDRIVYGNYVASRAPRLLQTWIALWSLTDTARIRHVLVPLVKHLRGGDPGALDAILASEAPVLSGIGMQTGATDTATVLEDLDAWCDLMQELEEGRATVDETVDRLERSTQQHPRYHIDLRVMEEAFATMPWALEPLARNGLRCHAQCFLMPHETMSLGLEQGLPWQRPWH